MSGWGEGSRFFKTLPMEAQMPSISKPILPWVPQTRQRILDNFRPSWPARPCFLKSKKFQRRKESFCNIATQATCIDHEPLFLLPLFHFQLLSLVMVTIITGSLI